MDSLRGHGEAGGEEGMQGINTAHSVLHMPGWRKGLPLEVWRTGTKARQKVGTRASSSVLSTQPALRQNLKGTPRRGTDRRYKSPRAGKGQRQVREWGWQRSILLSLPTYILKLVNRREELTP